ncbi:MAG TPA: hypothetical protein P5571_11975 [Candidatus Krumholzibacteria bacterium]|nr:hypothetical protein [Candidatus Krumholzibacteria bacterium]HRX52076.1 hypothetical protein [Candidatus Krumholzibacteria bacterium]
MTDDLGFRWQARKNGEVAVTRGGKVVTVLRGDAAREFLADAAGADPLDMQQDLARLTGNYKRGNERLASEHPRNRER